MTAASRELRSAAAVRTVASSRSFDQGLETKSVAPRFIASTAIWTPAWAVIITTTACGSRFNISASQWKPSAALVAPRPKLASSRTTSGSSSSIAASASSGAWKVGDLAEQVAQQQPRGQQDVRIVVDDDAAPEALRPGSLQSLPALSDIGQSIIVPVSAAGRPAADVRADDSPADALPADSRGNRANSAISALGTAPADAIGTGVSAFRER